MKHNKLRTIKKSKMGQLPGVVSDGMFFTMYKQTMLTNPF
ncbi:hypothetical protein SAMN05216167_12178 [Spirosoma endophyticum]|uniref:Uncharacterized protein n=1 Tax=Spirosoma endophyticum TaxID=662367 RepID=A0A1I2E957_9BACT|nr:hypothetical protein SAMN05216167_12178 [Spirosoma endophyticum]